MNIFKKRNYPCAKSEAYCDIKLSCAEKPRVNTVSFENSEGLILVPGTVSDRLCTTDCSRSAEIVSEPCSYEPCSPFIKKRFSLRLEDHCGLQTDAASGYIPAVNFDAAEPVMIRTVIHVGICKETGYGDNVFRITVTFKNYSRFLLNDLILNIDLKESTKFFLNYSHSKNDINDGIFINNINPESCVSSSFYVTSDQCGASGFINRIYANYKYYDACGVCHDGVSQFSGCGCEFENSANLCHKAENTELKETAVKYIRHSFNITGFKSVRYAYIYHNDIQYHASVMNGAFSAGYGIAIRYKDANGKNKEKIYTGSAVFFDILDNYNPRRFRVNFSCFNYSVSNDGNVYAEFSVNICINNKD